MCKAGNAPANGNLALCEHAVTATVSKIHTQYAVILTPHCAVWLFYCDLKLGKSDSVNSKISRGKSVEESKMQAFIHLTGLSLWLPTLDRNISPSPTDESQSPSMCSGVVLFGVECMLLLNIFVRYV